MPEELPQEGFFDKFASAVAHNVARAWFFSSCVALVLIWLPTIVLLPFDISQLLINTATTIITFLLVALLQNTQDRSTRALSHKVDALLDAVAQILEDTDTRGTSAKTIDRLRQMSGVEMESAPEG